MCQLEQHQLSQSVSRGGSVEVLQAYDDNKIFIPPSLNVLNESLSQNKENFYKGQVREEDLARLSQKVDEIYSNLCQCIQKNCVTKDDMEGMDKKISLKMGKEDVEQLML